MASPYPSWCVGATIQENQIECRITIHRKSTKTLQLSVDSFRTINHHEPSMNAKYINKDTFDYIT